MPFVEVFTPRGAVARERRDAIASRLVAEVMTAEGAPDTPSFADIAAYVVGAGSDATATS